MKRNVTFEQKGFVTTVTINRPETLNALSSEVLADLDEAIDEIDPDATRCVIITGAGGKAFVAGADIAAMSGYNQSQAKDFCLQGNRIFRKIETMPVPVIAAIHGFALGGGCELAMACDIRLASEKAIFAQPEVGLGIPPGFGGTQRLTRILGLAKAKELLFTTNKIKASEALSLGLVSAVFATEEELLAEAMKLAERIAAQAPIAVRAAKRAANEGYETDIDSGIKIEAEVFSGCFESADQKEAMSAFMEKREKKPFVNR
ncbi:MAG: enoyl-CoA hydratase-related protein [Treponemataceae bacterium]|nr:MAG: enoyl-CoA hydratase-related protein [Treponemataceae bacterium]